MSMVTKQEILEFWKKHETPEAKEERREVEALKKDLRIAQDSIQDAIARYRKAKLRARSIFGPFTVRARRRRRRRQIPCCGPCRNLRSRWKLCCSQPLQRPCV